MASEFPKLKKSLAQIQWELDKQLQVLIDNNVIEDVEIKINESSFISRSHIAKSAYYLRVILAECFDESQQKIDANKIGEEHVSAAEGLLKLGKYSETAVNFLTKVLVLKLNQFTSTKIEDKPKLLKDLKKSASSALSECVSEIEKLNSIDGREATIMFGCLEQNYCGNDGKYYHLNADCTSDLIRNKC